MNIFPEIRQILRELRIDTDPEVFLAILSLVVARMSAALPFIPFLAGKLVRRNVQIAWTMMIGILLYPSLSRGITPGEVPPFGRFLGLLIKEMAIGVTIGILVQVVFSAMQAAGALIAHVAGLRQFEINAPQLPSPTGPMGQFLGQAAIVLYVSAGLHLRVIQSIADSYVIVPVLTFPVVPAGFSGMAELAGRMTSGFVTIALQLSAPVMFLVVLMHAGVALMNRLSNIQLDFQPAYTLLAYGSVFLVSGLLFDEFLRQSATYLMQIQQFVFRLR